MGCVKPPTVTVCAGTMGDLLEQAHAALGPTPADATLICGTPPLRAPPLHPEDVGAGGGGICPSLAGAGGDGAGGTFGGGGSPFGGGFAATSVGVGAGPSSADSSSADVGAGPSGAGGFGELKGRGGAGGAW
jgi:hypothetical protein